jgi:hypothetical protein
LRKKLQDRVREGEPVSCEVLPGCRPRRAAPGRPARLLDHDPPGDMDVMVGIAAAADYLGNDKPDSFRRARTPLPHPGEQKSPRRTWRAAGIVDRHSGTTQVTEGTCASGRH